MKNLSFLLGFFPIFLFCSCGSNPNGTQSAPVDPEAGFSGILDSSFGTSGVSSPLIDTGLFEYFYSAYDAALDSSNNIVISGSGWIYNSSVGGVPLYANVISKVKYSDGLPDLSFGGGDGSLSFYRNEYRKVKTEASKKIKALDDGSFLAAAVGGANKISSSGALDSLFGTDHNGYSDYYINDSQWVNSINDLTLLDGGKFITCGEGMRAVGDGYRSLTAISRYNADGTIDTSFGENGSVFLDPHPSINLAESACEKVVQTSSGGYLIVSRFSYVSNDSTESRYGFASAALNSDGSLDSNVNNGQINLITSPVGMIVSSDRMVADSDSSVYILASSYDEITFESRNSIYKINSNAELDSSFGERGIYQFPLGSQNGTVSLTSSGKLLVALNESNKISLYKILPSGTIDSSFGTSGKLQVNISGESPVMIKQLGSEIIGVTNKFRVFKLK